ncbi:MAG: hypothetical protein AOA66_1403 [Candidatus Bathyarchaeota archaeon BA2]|nr:MAG: hypothetical protein AOA66_1403 [Candidatus Bathyarchaeota archaeon BA2]
MEHRVEMKTFLTIPLVRPVRNSTQDKLNCTLGRKKQKLMLKLL